MGCHGHDRLHGFGENSKTGLTYNLMVYFGANSHTCQFVQKHESKFDDFSIKITDFQDFVSKNNREMALF